MGQPQRYSHNPHTLELDQYGTFVVRPGDCVSQYHWAVFGNWGNDKSWRSNFKQVLPGPPENPYIIKDLADPNKIDVGWRMTYYPKFDPPKKGGGNGADPGEGDGDGGHQQPGTGQPPVNLDHPGLIPPLKSFDFVFEAKYPKEEKNARVCFGGWVVAQFQGQIRGTLTRKTQGLKVTVINSEMRFAVETNLDRTLLPDTIGSYELTKKNRDEMRKAAQKGDRNGFMMALAAGFKATWRPAPLSLGYVTLTSEISIRPALLPLYIGILIKSAELEDVELKSQQWDLSVTCRPGFNLAPGPKFWAWLIQNMGQYASRAFIQSVSQQLVTFLTAEGTLIAGVATVGAMFALVSAALMSWAYSYAWNRGYREGLANAYGMAFAYTVAGSTPIRPRLWDTPGRTEEERQRNYDETIAAQNKGVEDAKTTAAQRLREEQHPSKDASDAERLVVLYGFIIAEAGGDISEGNRRLQDQAIKKGLEVLNN